MSERRNFPRIPVGLEATFQTAERLLPWLAFSGDISLGGMRIDQPRRLDPGQKILVNFTIPDQGQMSVNGVVVWCRKSEEGISRYQAGVQWVGVGPITQARLNAFLVDRTSASISHRSPPQPPSDAWRRVGILSLLGLSVLGGFLFSWLKRSRR